MKKESMVFVIAEIGVNWNGDYILLKQMMTYAKNSGCNAVKLQAYNKEIIKNHPEFSRLIKCTVTPSNINKIDQLAKSVDIEWFCTPMYPEAVDFLDPFVNRYKVRQYDGKLLLENDTSSLVEKILNTGKEVMISCDRSPKDLDLYDHPNIKWLYCVSKYPCSLEELDFTYLDDFDGFSNHHPHFIAPLSASILGAEIIEIHITSDKSKSFFDNNVSFDYSELLQLVDLIRRSEKLKK